MPDSPTTDINPELTKEGYAATTDATHITPIGNNGVQGMLDQTLGQILTTNPQAQQVVMQAMHLTPEQFEQMRSQAQGSQMMQMTIRELIESGSVQQVLSGEENVPQTAQKNFSLLDKIKSFLK